LTVAQRFIAGYRGAAKTGLSPVGTTEAVRASFGRPYGTYGVIGSRFVLPAVNCWSILKCPSGARNVLAPKPGRAKIMALPVIGANVALSGSPTTSLRLPPSHPRFQEAVQLIARILHAGVTCDRIRLCAGMFVRHVKAGVFSMSDCGLEIATKSGSMLQNARNSFAQHTNPQSYQCYQLDSLSTAWMAHNQGNLGVFAPRKRIGRGVARMVD